MVYKGSITGKQPTTAQAGYFNKPGRAIGVNLYPELLRPNRYFI